MQSSMRDYLKRWKANYKNEQEAEFQRRQDQREAQFEVRVQEEVEKRCDEELKKLVADVSKFRQWCVHRLGHCLIVVSIDNSHRDRMIAHYSWIKFHFFSSFH